MTLNDIECCWMTLIDIRWHWRTINDIKWHWMPINAIEFTDKLSDWHCKTLIFLLESFWTFLNHLLPSWTFKHLFEPSWTCMIEFHQYPVWYRYQVPIPGIGICMKKISMNLVSVRYGRYGGYRYRFGIDMGDIGNPVSYRVF